MTAFIAMLVDAYRHLNSKKLFWITLGLSGVIVVFYASFGFDETGMSMLFGLKHFDSEFLNSESPLARIFYRGIFTTFIVSVWLAWIATILALISTVSIFPDFLAEGAVDIVLSKPITRVRLFVYKYLTSLLFVLLQVGVFCIGIFLCMLWRLGEANWLVFAAIPLVTVFYSYLYSMAVLISVLTRSALAALLLTLLFWSSLWGLNSAQGIVYMIETQFEIQVEDGEQRVERLETQLAALDSDAPSRAALERQVEDARAENEKTAENRDSLATWNGVLRVVQAVLPKTSETIALLDRWLKEPGDINLMDLITGNVQPDGQGGFERERNTMDNRTSDRMIEEVESRSLWYVVGTSLLFECAILGIACVVFVRKDY